MSELSEVNCQAVGFRPWMGSSAKVSMEPALLAAPRSLPLKDSVYAFGFLSFYVTAYLGAGFAGIKAFSWVWMAIFG